MPSGVYDPERAKTANDFGVGTHGIRGDSTQVATPTSRAAPSGSRPDRALGPTRRPLAAAPSRNPRRFAGRTDQMHATPVTHPRVCPGGMPEAVTRASSSTKTASRRHPDLPRKLDATLDFSSADTRHTHPSLSGTSGRPWKRGAYVPDGRVSATHVVLAAEELGEPQKPGPRG